MPEPVLRGFTHTEASVTSTTGTALAANHARRYALFVNDGSVAVYLRLDGSDAIANEGIRLNAEGGSYEIARAAGNLYAGLVTAITASGTATVLVSEV